MATRAPRDWATIRGEIRLLIRETDETDPHYTNPLLLTLWNLNLDIYSMELAAVDEGYLSDEVATDLVAGQREYTLPETVDRIIRICLVKTVGSRTIERTLWRNERITTGVVHDTNPTIQWEGYRPSVRLMGELLLLEPKPTETITDGLRMDIVSMQPRFTGDASVLPDRFPAAIEAMMIIKTAMDALEVDEAMTPGNTEENRGRLRTMMALAERKWKPFIESRLNAPVRGRRQHLGD